MKVFCAEKGFCWGIEHGLAQTNKLAAGRHHLKAIHPQVDQGNLTDWDPLQFVRNGDPVLLNEYPHLTQVEVVDDLTAVDDGEDVVLGHFTGTPEIIKQAQARGITLHDYFTCPFVAKFNDTADSLIKAGHNLIAFGKPDNHHTRYAKQAAEAAGRIGLITENINDIAEIVESHPALWACLVQVTADHQAWEQFKTGLAGLKTLVKCVDTLCSDARIRQKNAAELAAKADVVIVVNDRAGSTVSVFEVCSRLNSRTYHYDPHDPLPLDLLAEAETAAVVGGIHVPHWVINQVGNRIMQEG